VGRGLFLDLAARGARCVIGADLVLHERADAEEVRLDPARLGAVIVEAARRYSASLAIALMDLRLEKIDLEHGLEADAEDAARPHPAEQQAHFDAIGWVAAHAPELVPVGMSIGPFSLMTKMVPEAIPGVALWGSADEPSVAQVERFLRLAEGTVARSFRAQIRAGARAMLVCEPAASIAFLSPRQMKRNPAVFEHFVLAPHLRLKALLDAAGVDLIFHDCGELTAEMVEAFGHRIHPAVLSLGSSRKLWEDAARVPDDVVLFGNLPTKTFYSDAAMPDEEVARRTVELIGAMRAAGHAHICGSECDVLYVAEAAPAIRRKVEILLNTPA
jgi:uroporphyrinogen-III decarboxylase